MRQDKETTLGEVAAIMAEFPPDEKVVLRRVYCAPMGCSAKKIVVLTCATADDDDDGYNPPHKCMCRVEDGKLVAICGLHGEWAKARDAAKASGILS